MQLLEAQRPAESDLVKGGVKALVTWCDKNGIPFETASGRDEYGRVLVVFRAQLLAGTLFVAFLDGFFEKALGTMIPGKGSLSDAKRALGMEVAARAPRAKRTDSVTEPKRATKADTLR